MKIIDILTEDYQRFPLNQSYNIYAENVYFQDPLNKFTGIKRYQKMIKFMSDWFKNIEMKLHNIYQENDTIYTQWTLFFTSPLFWQPQIVISGKSELKLNENNLIIAHFDYWDCSFLDVIKQHFLPQSK